MYRTLLWCLSWCCCPLVENADLAGQQHGQSTMTLVASLGPTALQTLLGLGALLLGGRVVLRRIFEMVCTRAHP